MIAEADIRRFGEGRWVVPVLALLDEQGGGRFASMAAQLDCPRPSLARTLEQLAEWGWITRNAGHGHPLRPEYLLTAKAQPLAAAATRIMATRRRLGLEAASLSRWALPVAAHLGTGWTRFGELEQRLSPVSPRALSMTLKQMIETKTVARRLESHFPPIAFYGLTRRGQMLAGAIRSTRAA